ncbi:hypothetical protein [Acidisphaera rubrifaciens]|uniref:hypothetical protein n=1 Tax=Acidisphaera rubrifaciens TaxID=50715 RepID=UPI0035A23CB4
MLIRPSGTEPVVRVMAEAPDETLVLRTVDAVCAALATATTASPAPVSAAG